MSYSHPETYETTTKNYLRPFVNLGNLNGPEGNAFLVIANVSNALKKCGYLHESKEISELFMNTKPISYENGLDKMSYFVDYRNDTTLLDEDDEFIYLKVRKNEGHFTIENNVPKIYSSEHLKDLLTNNINLNDTNTFGRNILFYPCDDVIVKDIINNTNIFIYDNIGGNPLSTNTSISNQLEILKKMIKIDPKKTQEFINQEDIFGRNFFSRLGSNYEKILKQKNEITLETLTETNLVIKIFTLLENNYIIVDPTKGVNLLDAFIFKTYHAKLAPQIPINLKKLQEIFEKQIKEYTPEEIILYENFILNNNINIVQNNQFKSKNKI